MPRKKRCASPFDLMEEDFDDTSSQSSRNGNPPIQRNAANARERARMRVLSSAFGRLKTKLPNIPADTKLSKLDTLRLATMYIKQLKSVVEGESLSPIANGESMEGTFINNNSTNCYLNLNMGAQSMNWPFGFHHHLSQNSPHLRPTSSSTLINISSSNNNWCARENPEEQMKHAACNSENYELIHHHHHPQQQSSSSMMDNSFLNHEKNHQDNDWFAETPSPDLDTTSSTCLSFGNSHSQQQQLLTSSHHHNLPHQQPASIHSSTFQLQHDFQHHHHHSHHAQQNLPSASHHLHQNGYVNSSNFHSTSIR